MTTKVSDSQPLAAAAAPAGSKWPIRRAYLITLALAACVYGATVQHGPVWMDSGYDQCRALRMQLTNPLGLALAHPLLIVMCQPLRLLGPHYVLTAFNMLPALGMAIAVANVLLLGFRLTGRPAAAVLAAVALGICHTAMFLGLKSYGWVTAGLTTELLLLVGLLNQPRWWRLALLGLVNGLGFSMHNFALLVLPVYAVAALWLVARRQLPLGTLVLAAAAWGAGAALQLTLIVQAALVQGVLPAIKSALFGCGWQHAVIGAPLHTLAWGCLYLGMNWPFLSLGPVVLGWWLMARRVGKPVAAALGAVAAIHLGFAIRYQVFDQFLFLLPSYALLAIGAAVGYARLLELASPARRRIVALLIASLALTPVLYAVTPWLLTRTGHSVRGTYHLPLRDENRYWITPWRFNENSAERFAREILRTVPPNAVILASGTVGPPVQALQQVEGLAPGVSVQTMLEADAATGLTEPVLERMVEDPARAQRILGGRPLYVVANYPNPEMGPIMKSHTRLAPFGSLLLRVEFIDDPPAAALPGPVGTVRE